MIKYICRSYSKMYFHVLNKHYTKYFIIYSILSLELADKQWFNVQCYKCIKLWLSTA